MKYSDFLGGKAADVDACGFDADTSAYPMFPHQHDLVRWACRRGRAAIFADTGLGKTRMQLAWANEISKRCAQQVLILCPLAVAEQTVAEARGIGVDAVHARDASEARSKIVVTNYDRLHRFDPRAYSGIVLDESSCIKHHDAKTLKTLIEAFGRTPFRLCATATPAPNDWVELGTHAEFLGVRSRAEMLSEFFCHDGGETQVWRLKGHARTAFWRWVASWGAMIRSPSDLGHDGSAYVLPPCTVTQHVVDARPDAPDGLLFAPEAGSLMERRQARKASVSARVEACAAIVNASDKPWIVWCDLNAEGDALERAIDGAIQVAGSDSVEFKEAAVEWFCGRRCVCRDPMFSDKLSAWEQTRNINAPTTGRTGNPGSRQAGPMDESTARKSAPTFGTTTGATSTDTSPRRESSATDTTPSAGSNTDQTQPSGTGSKSMQGDGRSRTQTSGATSNSGSTGSRRKSTTPCFPCRVVDAPYVDAVIPATESVQDSMSITATQRQRFADCCAATAMLGSGSSTMIQNASNAQPCICGHLSGRRVLISKCSIFGYGMNMQHCSNVAFVGVTDSYETYYQSVRRCWRFGQKSPVAVHVFSSPQEGAVVANIKRKEADSLQMFDALMAETRDAMSESVLGRARNRDKYRVRDAMIVPSFLQGDTVEVR